MMESVEQDVEETLDRGEMDVLEPVSRVAPYRKAVVAVVTLVAVAAASFGIEVDAGLQDALVTVIAAVGALLTYQIPNDPVEVEFDSQGRESIDG